MVSSTFNKSLQAAALKLEDVARSARYAYDPVLWAEDILGAVLWSKEKEILWSLAENKRTAVKSCHSIGKTHTGAIAAAWWVSTREDCMVQSTAPTYTQVHAQLWEAIRKFHSAAGLIGAVNLDDRWRVPMVSPNGRVTSVLVGEGKKPADTNIHAFHGTHRPGGVFALLDEGCHDDQTEVLTRAGWKFWKDVTLDDEFLTMNPSTEETTYSKASKLISYQYSGDLYYYEAKGANFAVTPNHEMLYKQKSNGRLSGWRKAEMQDMYFGNRYSSKTIAWQGTDESTFILPEYTGKRKTFTAVEYAASDWAEFLGWFASEGSIAKDLYSVQIAQKQEHHRDEIRALLTRMGMIFSEYENGFVIFSGQLANHLVVYGRTCDVKRLPDYVQGWSPRLLNILIDAYIKGDGTFYPAKGHDIIYTSCSAMADDLQTIILKTGVPSVIHGRSMQGVVGASLKDGRCITSSRDGFVVTRPHAPSAIKLIASNVEQRHYDGMVYCATVDGTHTLFTRRGGYTLWSGNCGIVETLYTGAEAITTGRHDRQLAMGNPDDPNTEFGRIFRDDDGLWNLITVSVYDTPHYTDEAAELRREYADDPVKLAQVETLLEGMPQPEWAEERRLDWGEDSNRFQAKVLAQFPKTSVDSLFTAAEIEIGRANILVPSDNAFKVMAVDVARYGGDMTVCTLAQEGHVTVIGAYSTMDTMEVAARVHKLAIENEADQVRVDGIGVGGGVVDRLVALAQSAATPYVVVEMTANARPPDRTLHRNARAYWYDTLKHQLRNGMIDLPDGVKGSDAARLLQELTGINYGYPNGVMQIESKEDIRKRGDKSPDYVDSLVMVVAPINYITESPLAASRAGDVHEINLLDDIETVSLY